MPNLLLALIVGIAAMLLASACIWLWQFPRNETRDGLKALASLSWREFSRAVLAALLQRGYAADTETDAGSAPETQPNRLLVKGDERWLLACKHGSAYRMGAETMAELSEAVRMRNANGAFLATEGVVDAEGLRIARDSSIEVLAGARLWQAAKPHVPAALSGGVVGNAKRTAMRHTGIAALGSLALAAVVAVFAPSGDDEIATATAPAAAQHRIAAPTQAPGITAAEEPFETDEAALQAQREKISKELTSTPGIIRGFWISKLTLVIDRTGDDATVWNQVCGELERYPALRTSRVQLNPRPGTDDVVRWRQCRTY